MKGLEIRLLGFFAITCPSGSDISIEGRKAQELVSYLLLVPGQVLTRESAVEALWPETNPESGRKQIRQTLWQIHQALDAGATERLVIAEGDHLALNCARECWCDAVEFARAVEDDGSRTVEGSRTLEQALNLYGGPLLPGCYSEWCLIERERLEGIYLLALDAASVQAESRGDNWAATKWASKLLRIDAAHEGTHRRLMQLYYAMGDRTRALRQFERCCSALRTELGVQPSSRTIAVASAIRGDCEPPAVRAVSLPTAGVSSNESLRSEIMSELATMRQSLDDLERSIEKLGQ